MLTKTLKTRRPERSSYNAMAHRAFLKAKNIATLCILESPEKIRAKELTAMITTMSCQSLSVMTRSPSTIGLILNSKDAIGLQVTS